MKREFHARFWERLGVRFPRATRLVIKIRGRRYWLWRAVDDEGEKSALPLFTIRDYERTIGPRTHTNRCDDANENNIGSSHRDRPNGSCRSTPPSTTLSTSNAIFYRAAFSRRFEPRRSRSGIKVGLLPDPDRDPIVATAVVNVSMPLGVHPTRC